MSFVYRLKRAAMLLKGRANRTHKTRIVIFVGSPVTEEEKEVCLRLTFSTLKQTLKLLLRTNFKAVKTIDQLNSKA